LPTMDWQGSDRKAECFQTHVLHKTTGGGLEK
jgi:hypothetical protein